MRCSVSGRLGSASTVLRPEGAVNVVDVLGALAVGEECVEDHDGASIHEAHLVLEGAAKDVNDVPLARKLLT